MSLLAAAGLAVGALLAVPLGPWVELRRKRRVMIAMDAVRFFALMSVALAYALGSLTFAHLVVVAVVIGAAGIAHRAAVLILATAPLLAVLMLGELDFEPWEYGLAFALPCVGGLLGSRMSRRLVTRYGRHRVMLVAGSLRACWSIGLAFVVSGAPGLLLVIGVQFGLVTCMGVFNPIFATYRLEQTENDRIARTLTAWSVSSSATIATLTALWGVLAAVTGVRVAIGAAGVLMLATPLLLPRRELATAPVA